MNVDRKPFFQIPTWRTHNAFVPCFIIETFLPVASIPRTRNQDTALDLSVQGETCKKSNRNQIAPFCESDPASGEITGRMLTSMMKVQWTKILMSVIYGGWDCYGACPHSVTQLRLQGFFFPLSFSRSLKVFEEKKKYEAANIKVSTATSISLVGKQTVGFTQNN